MLSQHIYNLLYECQIRRPATATAGVRETEPVGEVHRVPGGDAQLPGHPVRARERRLPEAQPEAVPHPQPAGHRQAPAEELRAQPRPPTQSRGHLPLRSAEGHHLQQPRVLLPTALSYLQMALKLELTLADSPTLSDTYLNLCAVLSQLDRHDEAIQNIYLSIIMLQHELLTKQAQQERFAILVVAYHNLGVEMEFQKKELEAKKIFNQALVLAEQNLPTSHPMTKNLRNIIQHNTTQQSLRLNLPKVNLRKLEQNNKSLSPSSSLYQQNPKKINYNRYSINTRTDKLYIPRYEERKDRSESSYTSQTSTPYSFAFQYQNKTLSTTNGLQNYQKNRSLKQEVVMEQKSSKEISRTHMEKYSD